MIKRKKIQVQNPEIPGGLRVEKVSHFYGRTQILHSVSFTAAQGEVCVILGPNGAGKTTLMRLITGYFLPIEGRIWLGSEEMTHSPIRTKRLLGYLPEHFPVYPYLSIQEFLGWCLKLRGFVGKKSEEVKRVLKIVGLEDRAGQAIRKLSKGMRQRVALAQALIGKPSFIVLDEPTSGLDPHQIKEMRDLITSLKGTTTVILSTHILAEAAQVADRVVILSGGCVIASGRPAELAEVYLKGETAYRVGLQGEFHALETKLKNIEAIHLFELIDGVQGRFRFELRLKPEISEEKILSDLEGAGIRPFEFYRKELKLEDIFMKAVTEETVE